MAYTALYRKFRPLNFSEMVGQEHITQTLKKQIIADRVGHAYLFNGGRGTGKTSAAKILARAVNCLNVQNGEPCNECEICKGILSGALTDVVEMDAASNNSVEDIRSIREEVNFLPTRAKYRVYIIDEVHMLSTGAFNALLKTLEEPPEHVKFILATTEPQKMPATILSRCQRFDFKRISNEDVIKRLKVICEKSNIEITEDALKIIAVLSEGAMRDAISILERCTGEDKGLIDGNYVRDLVGMPKTFQIYEIAKGIIEYDLEKVITATNGVINEGKDIDNFLWEIIKYIKDLLVYKSTKNLEIYDEQEKEQMKNLVENISKERLLKIIYNLSNLANNLKWSSQKTIIFQAGIINACMEETAGTSMTRIQETAYLTTNKGNVGETISRPQEITKSTANAKSVGADTSVHPKTNASMTTNKENAGMSISFSQKNRQSITNGSALPYWNNVINTLKQNGKMGIYVNLIGSKAMKVNDLVIEVALANKNTFAKQVLEAHENKAEIEKIVSQEEGKTMNIRFVSGEEKKTEKNATNPIENIANDLDIPFNIIDE